LQYNLKNIVNVPTIITKNTATPLDVVITNENKSLNSIRVMDLGLSDRYAQILSILTSFSNNIPHRVKKKRHYSEANVQEFFYLLNQVTWQDVYRESDVNAKFSIFFAYIFSLL
jgi:hypothetical protein